MAYPVVLAVLAVRIVLYALGRSGGSRSITFGVRPIIWVPAFRLVIGMLGVLALEDGNYALAAALSIPVLPDLWLNFVLIPARSPLAAYAFGFVTRPYGAVGDVRGGAVLAAMLALARRKCPSIPAWLTVRLELAELTARGPSLVAGGVAASLRGDRDSAVSLMSLVRGMDGAHASYRVRAIAVQWLIADAAMRGDWTAVLEVGRDAPKSRWSSFVVRAARLLLRQRRPFDRILIWPLWLLAPGRRHSFALARTAAKSAWQPEQSASHPPRASGAALLALLASRPTPVNTERVLLAGSSWDEALRDPGFQQRVADRARQLSCTTPVTVLLEQLSAKTTDALAEFLRRSNAALPELPEHGILADARESVREGALAEIEYQCAELARNESGDGRLSGFQRWLAWGRLRITGERLLRQDRSLGPLVFDIAFTPVNHAAVQLHNDEREYVLAHDMFHWLASVGTHSANAEALRIARKNVRLGRRL